MVKDPCEDTRLYSIQCNTKIKCPINTIYSPSLHIKRIFHVENFMTLKQKSCFEMRIIREKSVEEWKLIYSFSSYGVVLITLG